VSYEDYLRTAVFEPIGMERSGVAIEPLVDPRAATGYQGYAGSGDAVAPLHASWWKGAGGIYSTVEDLYRWERALTTGELLGADASGLMHATQSPTSGLDYEGYGYGWQIIEPQQIVWHGGDLPGYHAMLFRDRRNDLTIVGLTNDDAWANRWVDLITLYDRARFLETQPMFPVVRLIGIGAAVAGLLSGLMLIVAVVRNRRRLSRPSPIRFVSQFVVPLALVVLLLLLAFDPVTTIGSWTALTVVAPAVAWFSASLLGMAVLVLVLASSAFVRPAE